MQNILHPYYNAMDNGQLTMDNSADAHQLGGEMSFSSWRDELLTVTG